MNLLYNRLGRNGNLYIYLISILGLVLRLINIDKPEGLWNDEYVSWMVASTPLHNGFWQEVLKQCHMPLYYFYLKPFVNCSDLVLRLTSVVPSVFAIPVMYLAGKEFSRKTGRYTAALTATLPFLIYYSQEVRFYSLVFLLCALSMLFTIRLLKTESKKNWILWGSSLVLILLTHVLGVIYVFFNALYVIYKKKHVPAKIVGLCGIVCIIVFVFGINILKMLPSSQWWGRFGYSNILFLFSDFLSPILTNNVNAPAVFFYTNDFICVALMTIPTVVAAVGLILGAKKEKGIALIALLTILGMTSLALTGNIVFITKYSIEVLPIFILLISLGFNKKFGNILIGVLLFFYICTVFTPYHPVWKARSEGNKLAADMINSVNSDNIIFTYYAPKRFERYLKINPNTRFLTIEKTDRFKYQDKPEVILANVKKGETASILILQSVSFIPQDKIKTAQEMNIPEMFITFSKIKHGLISALKQDFTDYKVENKGEWILITAKKYK